MTTEQRRGIIAVAVFAGLLVVGGVFGAVLTPAAAPATRVASPAIVWLSRSLLLLCVAWLVIGMLAARTRVVGAPGAAAARATWLAASRPWRARESTLGLLSLDRWLIFIVPVAVLIATRMLQTALTNWLHLAIVVGAWTVFALVLRLAVGRRSPWPVIAAVGGVVVLRCILTLVVLSIAGPDGFSHEFWLLPALRTLFVAAAFAGFAWGFVAAGWALRGQGGSRYAAGSLLAALGAGLALPALGVALAGAQNTVEGWDDGLGLVPHAVLTVFGLPVAVDAVAWCAVVLGVAVCVAGFVTLDRRSERRPAL
ncbi:MAG: hypothetical protein QM626_07630 [Microbacterium sp.]|uniref:hypothetical protein n=1 Tax=Microbacterium sp. TaxID=51671 RepID=UPI0039E3591F